jgi:hypothetical protein
VSYYLKRGIIRQPVDMLRHEAGHMVMAKLLGFDTGKLTYSPKGAGAKIMLNLSLPDIFNSCQLYRTADHGPLRWFNGGGLEWGCDRY